MKRFTVVSLLMLFAASRLLACIGEGNTYNWYMFSIFHRSVMEEKSTSELNKYWSDYTGHHYSTIRWSIDEVIQTAKERKDQQAINYLTQLKRYLEISDQLQDSWTYPTKQELAQRKADLQKMVRMADAYNGKDLRNHWMLLRMRANMVLGNHADNVTYWNTKASKSENGVFHQQMENIYAGALFHTGDKRTACDIYAKQGDMISLKWCVRKMRNFAGIKTIYEQNPNSPTLVYLVQDFVNNAQESIDTQDKEWLEHIGAQAIYRDEVMQMIAFANQVAADNKTNNPCMWKAAAGALHFLMGEPALAQRELIVATQMNGTQRMKDNAKAILILATAAAHNGKEYGDDMLTAMKWLDQKCDEERKEPDSYYNNHYTDIRERLLWQVLGEHYKNTGQKEMYVAVHSMVDEATLEFFKLSSPRAKGHTSLHSEWNTDFTGEAWYEIEQLTADETAEYLKFIKGKHPTAFEQYVMDHIYKDETYFNDIIGTKYIAEGKPQQAIPYLEKVPGTYYDGMNISMYMSHRSYNLPRWHGKQKVGVNEDEPTDGPHLGRNTNNQKLDFCRDLIDAEKNYNTAKGEFKALAAYRLATLYYQVSYLGDCWYLAHYFKSNADNEYLPQEKKYEDDVIRLLEESSKSNNLQTREQSLFALAYIPIDPWADVEFKYDNNRDKWIPYYTPIPGSRQYKALNELYLFNKQHPEAMTEMSSKCDVLKAFARRI